MAFKVSLNHATTSTKKLKLSKIDRNANAPANYGVPEINFVHLKGAGIEKATPKSISHVADTIVIICESASPGTDQLVIWFYARIKPKIPPVALGDLVVTVETAGVSSSETDAGVTAAF